MSLALSICIALVIVVLGVLGYARDIRRGLLALLGTLGGAALVEFWGARWGAALAGGLLGDQQRTTFIANSLLFLWGALIVGYGGALLLGRSAERATVVQRLPGALLGLLNGVLVVGFLLRYASEQQPTFAAMVAATPAAQLIHDWLPVLFLVIAAGATLLMLVRGLVALLSHRVAPASPPPAPEGASPSSPGSGGSAASPAQRVDDRGVLGKVNDATRR
jgi:uncharacterized membrane protein required for colicin V production